MIVIKLREAMERYKRAGANRRRMTYEILSDRTGLAKGTLTNIGSSDEYNATLGTIERICRALDVTPGFLLELIDDKPKPKSTAKKEKKTKPKKP